VTAPVWSAAGATVRPLFEYTRRYGLTVHSRQPATLPPELVRSLRDWLTWWLSDDGTTPSPADPDTVRLAIDLQRAALRERSLEPVSEDFRAGLAWADNALDAIHRAAGGAL